jgi:hypothetical protein
MRSRNDDAREATRDGLAEGQDWLRARWFAALAGLVAGLVAFGIGEATHRSIPARKIILDAKGKVMPAIPGTTESVAAVRDGAIVSGELGLCLGGILGIAGGLSRGSRSAAWKAGALGSTVGAVLAGGITLALLPSLGYARTVYPGYGLLISMATHGLMAGLAGAAGGLAFAAGLGQRRRLARAAMAGLAGAVMGAVVFDMVGVRMFPLADAGELVSAAWPLRAVSRLWVATATAAFVALILPAPPPPEVLEPPPKKSRRRRQS